MTKNLTVYYAFLALILVVMIFSYVHQVSALTEETYLIERYQEKIDAYSRESQTLEYQFLQSNSFFEIENVAQKLDFEPVERVSYIEVLGSEVVVK